MRASVIAVSLFSAWAVACSDEDPEPDGGVIPQADAVDDYDGGVIADARIPDAVIRDADPPDLGAPDVGGCGCSYGFQQQCAEDEFCGGGFDIAEGPRCVRAEPFGSVSDGACSMVATATGTAGAGCNAQCIPTSFGSPCSAIADRAAIAGAISSWGQAIYNASTMGPLPGPNAMSTQDINNATDSLLPAFPECGLFVQRTVIAAVALCRGEGSVIPETGGIHVPSTWKFRHFDEDDECLQSTGRCLVALRAGVSGGVGAASAVDEIPASCPNGLPYAAPCQGPDAQRCLRARIESMIRALNEN
jgi:hypothetical protein